MGIVIMMSSACQSKEVGIVLRYSGVRNSGQEWPVIACLIAAYCTLMKYSN
jgi:hypothetical protein